MKKYSLASLLPVALFTIVPAFALSSEWATPFDDETKSLASYQDPAFSAETSHSAEGKDAPQPDSWAGALGASGRAGMMIARGARGMNHLRNAGIMGGNDDMQARGEGLNKVSDTDFDY